MNFIKKIFEGKIDEEVHRQFRRFSKGNFEDRAIVEIIVSRETKIKTSFEYTNELVKYLANTIIGKTHITGGIITTKDLKETGLKFESIKQFAGVKTYQLNTELTKEELNNIMNEYADAIFCLSFKTEYGGIKTKVKSPKSAKPGKDGKEAKADYCAVVTKDANFKKEFAFDVKNDFKKFKAKHDFIITELTVPQEYKNDFEKARIYSKRKGKIIRKLNIDGKEIIKELSFEA